MKHQIVEPARVSWMWAIPATMVLFFLLLDPVGYGGGGADDDRYIAGADCWLTNGPCLPVNHWEGRWPVVSVLALSFKLFGLSRLSLALPFLLASLVCFLLIKHVGDRLFGRSVGLAGAVVFAVLPVFLIQATSATVEPLELALILACFVALLHKRALLAGLALGLAFQTRETSIAAFLPAAAMLWRNWRGLAYFALGFASPLLTEFLVFFLSTGDPLYRRMLSAGHTLIPSSELKVMDGGLPFFNASLIQNWNYEPGLHVHWLIDGFLNLMVNAKAGLLFLLTPAFLFLYRDRLSRHELRISKFMMLGAYFYAAVLIYVLAIDPKPRMMYVPLAALSLVLGLVMVRAWSTLLAAVSGVVLLLMALSLAAQSRNSYWEAAADGLNARYSGQIETSQYDYFLFNDKLSRLPPIGSGKPYLLLLKSEHCDKSANEDPMNMSGSTVVAEKRGRPLAALLGNRWTLCLYRYRTPPPAGVADDRFGWRRRIFNPSVLRGR